MAEQGEQVQRPPHGKAWDGVDAPMGKGEQALIRSERMQPRKGNQQDGAHRERERAKCN